MKAVIRTGGKQYLVSLGQKLKIEKIEVEVGKTVVFDDVLLVSGDDVKDTNIGQPQTGVKVEGKVLEQAKDKKVIVFKYKPKKRYKVKKGHRQFYTLVEILKIGDKKIEASVERKPISKNEDKPKVDKNPPKADQSKTGKEETFFEEKKV
jgi:large subunit ribosomal protein L21